MQSSAPPLNLEETRKGIVRRLREVRLQRGWSQAELAEKLGLSQARLSVIERGGGTISAEQFVALLALTNLPIETFLPEQDLEDELQNALARLGALHLRELENVVPTSRFQRVEDAVVEALAAPRSSRLVLALAPVVVWNADHLSLDQANERLARIGLSARLGWLAENTVAAIAFLADSCPREWRFRARVARVTLTNFLARVPRSTGQDILDAGIASAETLRHVRELSSPISRSWGIISELQPADFGAALGDACASG
jgi:transcriptional regulator with XRE-family HTH domain